MSRIPGPASYANPWGDSTQDEIDKAILSLGRTADLMEADSSLQMVPAFELASKDDGPLGDMNVSHALNVYLDFPSGTWWSWESDRTREQVIATLRDAARVQT